MNSGAGWLSVVRQALGKDRLAKNEEFNFQVSKQIKKSSFLEGLTFRKSLVEKHLKTVAFTAVMKLGFK